MSFSSSKISLINPDDERSWKNKIFFTFDVDWAHDEVIADTLALLRDAGYESTWFATHSSNYLSSLIDEDLIEVGVHPNFNNLMSRESAQDSRDIIAEARAMVPNATSLRSHSLKRLT